MGNVIQFPKKEEKELLLVGKFVCMQCKHEWDGEKPLEGPMFVECPSCSLFFGHHKATIEYEGKHWVCNCGNSLFCIHEHGTYCPYCGRSLG